MTVIKGKNGKAVKFGKHGKVVLISGQVVAALSFLPWESFVGVKTVATWKPFFIAEPVQGLLFAAVSWMIYEMYEFFR
jgi:hypothetical protein